MVASTRRLAANRSNAKRSTGPRTAKGKRRSSRNALRHGLLARSVVVKSIGAAECQADFDNLLADLVTELQPQGLIEETLVERIATCYWRLRRAQNFETASIGERLESPVPPNKQLAKAEDHLHKACRNFEIMRELTPLLLKSDDQLNPDESQRRSDLIANFMASYSRFLIGRDPAAIKDGLRKGSYEIVAGLESEITYCREEIAQLQAQQARRNARRPLVKSLPNRDSLLRVVRYENMLDRQLHRALAEFRRCRSSSGTHPSRAPRRHAALPRAAPSFPRKRESRIRSDISAIE